MNGVEFYRFLSTYFTTSGQPLYNNITFNGWMDEPTHNTRSFRFHIPGYGPRVISADILMAAWEAGMEIDNDWLILKFQRNFYNDQRLDVLNYLLGRRMTGAAEKGAAYSVPANR